MGTTLTALAAGGGVGLQFVAAIEGVSTLGTTGTASQATTAWAASDFTAAVAGMVIKWGDGQSIRPWSAEVDPMNVSIGFPIDSADTFGKMIFGSAAGFETRLNAAIDSNDTTVTVLSTSTFPSSGTIHIGTEAITYSGVTSTTFTGCTRGRYAPLKASSAAANIFGRAHPLPAVGDGMVIKPWVTSKPRVWVGRWVGIWAHRNVGGTLDTLAQAQLIYAGKIVGTRDDADGMTWIELVDARSAIRDCVLLNDQWTARLKDGIYIGPGVVIDANDTKSGTTKSANALTFVSSAAGTNEALAGIYSANQFADLINQWLAAELSAGRLNLTWTWDPIVYPTNANGEPRSQLAWTNASAAGTDSAAVLTAPAFVFEFMGFDTSNLPQLTWWTDGTSHIRVSDEIPYAQFLDPVAMQTIYYGLELEGVRGEWFNNGAYFPEPMSTNTGAVQIGDGPLLLITQVDADSYSIAQGGGWLRDMGNGANTADLYHRRANEPPIILKQVAILSGTMTVQLSRFMASTGTAAYNGTYDVLPSQLGAAIPWQILGTDWVTSVDWLSQSSPEPLIVIERPTRLTDALGADLMASLCSFVWKNQGIRLTSWSTPAAALALHAFTEGNKAAPSNTTDNHRTPANDDDAYLVNQVKLEYNRVLIGGGGYRDTINIIDKASQYDHGVSRPVTLSMRNTFASVLTDDSAISVVAERLAAALRLFSQPLRLLRRTIALTHYENCAPGDICTLDDDHVRDAATGARGISGKAGLIVSHRVDWGGMGLNGAKEEMAGEIDVLLLPRDKVVGYCPCAQVTSYNAGTKTMTFAAHQHSETTQTVDVGSFAAGDKVRFIEIDPDDPDVPNTWTDTIVSVDTGANTCVITTGSGGYSSSLTYRMISTRYSLAVSAQQARAYLADDADGMVEDTISACEYGQDASTAVTWTNAAPETEKAALYSSAAYGDGVALDVGYERDSARLVNNLVQYRTAPILPQLYRNILSAGASGVRKLLAVEPMILHPGVLNTHLRYLFVRIWGRTDDGSTRKLYVSLCRHPPIGASNLITDLTAPEYVLVGPYTTVEMTFNSTTWTVGNQQQLTLASIDPNSGIAYLVIEGAIRSETRGLAMCQVGGVDV